MSSLPEVNNPLFEMISAGHIHGQLKAHGPAPWSICEARLKESDYLRLCEWASVVTVMRLSSSVSSALVLFAFIAEWNRRNSSGDTVWVGLPEFFRITTTRNFLFTASGSPSQNLYRKIREAYESYQLRCIKDNEDRTQRYYLTVQLQYGFSRQHAMDQLSNWLRGHPAPEVVHRLLAIDGENRSASFMRLVRDMKSYRKNYLPESEFRRTLRNNPWILPAWENEIFNILSEIPASTQEEEEEFRLLSDPKIIWEDGPTARCRVFELPDRLTAPRYILRHAGVELNSYFRNSSGKIEANCHEVFISLDKPEAIVTLETPEGVTVEVQSIYLWRPELIAQIRPLGREIEEASERLLAGEQVLITSVGATVTPKPPVWKTFGPKDVRRRWWLIDTTTRVTVSDKGDNWNGEPLFSTPSWTDSVCITLGASGPHCQLGDRVRFNINNLPNGAYVVHAICADQPLGFADAARTRTNTIPIRPNMSGQCQLRIVLARGQEIKPYCTKVNLPVRAALWADEGTELARHEAISCFELMNRPVKLLSESPTVLIEGREILGTLIRDKATRIKRVLGTGEELLVADNPFHTQERFRIAKSVVDSGCAKILLPRGEYFRLKLFRSILPTELHRLIIWSPQHGLSVVQASEIVVENDGKEWSFRLPWQTNNVLAAISYAGYCIAVSTCGDLCNYFDPQALDGIDLLARIALIRWCRLPGLKPDTANRGQPLVVRLANFPVEMIKVALLDQGLPEYLGLEYEDRQSPRGELFNVIFRELYINQVPEKLTSVLEELGNDFDLLLVTHPILGCRFLQASLPSMVQKSLQQTKAYIRGLKLHLLSLTSNASQAEIMRKEELLVKRACCTSSENGEPMDEYALREGLIDPILNHVMEAAPLNVWQLDNLRTALGVASFREYLANMILSRTIEHLP